jgi:hypothetical protein
MASGAQSMFDPESIEHRGEEQIGVREAGSDHGAGDGHIWRPLGSPAAVRSEQDAGRDMSRGKHRG